MAHKTTIKKIESIFKEFPNGKYFDIKVNKKETDRFWSIEVDCSKRKHIINELTDCAWFIGHMFGENISYKQEKNIVTIW